MGGGLRGGVGGLLPRGVFFKSVWNMSMVVGSQI